MLWAILFIFSFLATFCVAVLPRPTRTLRLQPFERSTSPTTPTSSSSSTGSNDSLHPSMRLHRASSSSGRPATPPSTPLPSSSMSDANFLMPSPSSTTDSKPIEENVRVLVRVRPLSDKEKDNRRASACCWETGPCTIRLSNWASTARTPEPFYFDAVVTSPNTDQVYSSCISDVVKSAMRGFNGTVFAYGQTASGKTYTMMGDQDQPGVIPRAVDDVFAFIEQDLDRREYMLRVSYLEIYNEQIRDLLSCNPSHENLKVVEQDSRMVVQGLIEEKVATRAEVLAIIKRGENNRHVGATDYNAHSSRSHAIFQMVVESRSKSRNVVRISQLNLIDLAGSEKATTDKNRLTEGRYINRSLLTLGNVIASLTNKKRRNTHVPYRDSILTRVLQTALSGNARISVICTVNPTTACKDESMNTLRFAQHAKQVQTSAKTTRISEHSVLQECLRTIADLQSKVREKDDQEAETHMRLARLMSLVLTSSKQEASTLIPNDMQNAFLSNGGMPNIELTSDLFARCEEHLTATLQEKEGLAMAMAKIADEKQALEVSMHEKDVLVSALTHSLREKEELISALSAALKQKDEDIAQKENHLSQKESHLSLFITAADNLQRELEDSKRREAETTQALKDAQSALDALAEKEKRKANKKAYMYDPLLPAGPWTFVFALVIYAWAS